MNVYIRTVFNFLPSLLWASFCGSILAQEVSIPDVGLNAAIREALQKPLGPLTEQDLLGLTNLDASRRNISSIAGLEAARNLISLDLQINRLANLSIPSQLTNVSRLDLSANPLTNLSLPSGLKSLTSLAIEGAELSSLTLPETLIGLTNLDLGFNAFTTFSLPGGLTNLRTFYFAGNLLTNIVLPPDLNRLESLDLGANQLTSLTLPAGLTSLVGLFVVGNQLTNITLPPDMTRLLDLGFLANPLTTFVLPETLAATNLAVGVASLENQGVSVFPYRLTVQLIRLRQPIGAFQFAVTGPPGDYAILGSSDLAIWSEVGTVANPLGSIVFTDVSAHLSPRKFYRALRQDPPTNMVFIPPNTFTMGSPTNDPDRSIWPADRPRGCSVLRLGPIPTSASE